MSDGGFTCGRCGSENAAGSVFCGQCGALLAAYASPEGSESAEEPPPSPLAPSPPEQADLGPTAEDVPDAVPAATVGAASPTPLEPEDTSESPGEPATPVVAEDRTLPSSSAEAAIAPTASPSAMSELDAGAEAKPFQVDDTTSAAQPVVVEPDTQAGTPAAAIDAAQPVDETPSTLEAPDPVASLRVSTVGTEADAAQPSATSWRPAAWPPTETPGSSTPPSQSWTPRSFVPSKTPVQPAVLVVGAIIGFCVLASLLRALPIGGWSFFVIFFIAIAIVNAIRKRR